MCAADGPDDVKPTDQSGGGFPPDDFPTGDKGLGRSKTRVYGVGGQETHLPLRTKEAEAAYKEEAKSFISGWKDEINGLSSGRDKLIKAKQLISNHFKFDVYFMPLTDDEILDVIAPDFPDIDTIDRGYESEE